MGMVREVVSADNAALKPARRSAPSVVPVFRKDQSDDVGKRVPCQSAEE